MLFFGYFYNWVGGVSLKIFVGVMLGIFFYVLNGFFFNFGIINLWLLFVSVMVFFVMFLVVVIGMLWWVEWC